VDAGKAARRLGAGISPIDGIVGALHEARANSEDRQSPEMNWNPSSDKTARQGDGGDGGVEGEQLREVRQHPLQPDLLSDFSLFLIE
ncbi:hypothetical protein CRG98_033943, partial [Punica granatum]